MLVSEDPVLEGAEGVAQGLGADAGEQLGLMISLFDRLPVFMRENRLTNMLGRNTGIIFYMLYRRTN